ncbi:hypothetical protein Tsp_01420 [Trichinella spiralis]|uniref:hypothetical protein n=1 Tax=Trichinella spiralis TaxID=6334 RepID=UPI0001EFB4D8|nr:hypothetical protein Tsp_01420 [Trichinella spiralis]
MIRFRLLARWAVCRQPCQSTVVNSSDSVVLIEERVISIVFTSATAALLSRSPTVNFGSKATWMRRCCACSSCSSPSSVELCSSNSENPEKLPMSNRCGPEQQLLLRATSAADLPYESFSSISTLWRSSKATKESVPCWAATLSAVAPSAQRAFGSAPFSSRRSATLVCDLQAETINAVRPSLSRRSTEAPDSSNSCTVYSSPTQAATCNGPLPCVSTTSTSALYWSSVLMQLTCPAKAA